MERREPSEHQKRIQFLTWMFVVIIMVATGLIFWVANRGFGDH